MKKKILLSMVLILLGAFYREAFAGGFVVSSPVQNTNESAIDYEHAQGMPLLNANIPLSTSKQPTDTQKLQPKEFGTSNLPYTTSRVDLGTKGVISRLFPYSAVGKLYFNDLQGNSYVCTASLIKKGIAVTAAHCVAGFGTNTWYLNFQYVPAQYQNRKPFGTWKVKYMFAISSYLDGSDPCLNPGVVCQNDIALLVITPKGHSYPGTRTGWLGYGTDGYGFAPTSVGDMVLISELGYPGSHDYGLTMQRTDAFGLMDASVLNSTIWGSRQDQGASGGPVIVNLGVPAMLSGDTSFGQEANFNTIIGVASWASYLDQGVKLMGASPFLSSNIGALLGVACNQYPDACMP